MMMKTVLWAIYVASKTLIAQLLHQIELILSVNVNMYIFIPCDDAFYDYISYEFSFRSMLVAVQELK